MNVAAALRAARELGVARLDAEALLAHLLAQTRTWLLAHDEAPLGSEQQARYAGWLARRAAGEPLAYLTGEKEFFGLMFAVSSAVLVPRPDTETLVEWALELWPAAHAATLADLGTGSGAIAVAVARHRPSWRVTAVDASQAALALARENGARHGVAVQWLCSDWGAALTERRFDAIVSNPPYIAQDDPHLGALRHEPREALVAGPQGLDALRHIVQQAPLLLEPGGWLLLEHGFEQAGAVTALLRAAGFSSVCTRADLGGQPRCSGGRRPA